MSRWGTAWTITKLKVVRAVLSPLLRWHIRREAKERNKHDDIQG